MTVICKVKGNGEADVFYVAYTIIEIDLMMFARTTTASIRLVVLDYAGLTTNPNDLRKFIK